MKHADIEAAVDAALDRIGAMLGAADGEEVAGVVQQPGLAFASLDVNADEVFDVAERVTTAYLDQVDVTNNAALSVRGAFLTGYLVGRLHEPQLPLGATPPDAPLDLRERLIAVELLDALAAHDELGLNRRQAAAYNALAGLLGRPRWGDAS